MATDPFYDTSGQITPRGNRHQHPVSPGGPLIIHQPRPYDLLLRELDTLKSRLGQVDDELQSTVAELRESRRQVEKDAGVITSLQGKIVELEDMAGKQKITIANQSRAISDPKVSLRHRPSFALPGIPPAAAQQYTVHETAYEGFPSSAGTRLTNLFEPPPYAGYNASMPVRWPSGSQSPMSPMEPQPPTEWYPMYPYGMVVQPPTRGVMTMTSPAPITYAALDYETRVTDFGSRFQAIWTKAEGFARTFVAHPGLAADSENHHASNARSTSTLWNDATARPLHLAKIVNFHIVRDIIKYTEVVRGYDAAVDAEMIKIKGQMTSDLPASARHVMLLAVSNQVGRLKALPGFSDFCMRLRDHHMSRIWDEIKGLVYGDANEIRDGLRELVADAHCLAVDYYSTPYDLRFHFPDCGEKFDPGQMVNIDPWKIGHSSGSFRGPARVKLSITPITRIGDNSLLPPRLRVVNAAKVILRVPDEQWNKGHSPESVRTPKKKTAPRSATDGPVKDAGDKSA